VTDLFLGVIALGVLTMATIQVAAVVFALRAARRVGDAVSRFERDVEPIVANLQSLTAEATRATSVAAAQVERASQMMSDLARRVDETAAAVQSSIVRPAREGYAIFQGILAALAALRTTPPSRSKRPSAAEEEDALFIG
jgi:hypothetical protein